MTSLSSALLALGGAAFLWTWRNSLPLSWTVRIFYTQLRLRYSASGPANSSKGKVTSSEPHLLLSHLPEPGKDIFDEVFVSSPFTATIDECDFNFHLSNSSYPKNFDLARVEAATHFFLRGQLDGAWVALGGTSFRFLKEIPAGARYHIRTRILSWDDKWAYLQGEFITFPKRRGSCKGQDDSKNDVVVHCVALAKTCVKAGRKTIPPWLFFAVNGYSAAGTSANWDKAEDVRIKLLAESRAKARSRGRKDVQRDSWLAGRGYAKAAWLLTKYIPSSPSSTPTGKASDDAAERQEWMNQAYWDVAEWEEKRLQGLKKVRELSLAAF